MTATATPTQPFLATILDQHYRDMFPVCGTCEGTKNVLRGGPGDQLWYVPCPDCDKPRPVVLDDGPRLVYADWLEEQGECDRAEFIRVQVELARGMTCKSTVGYPPSYICDRAELFGCDRCLNMKREAELLERHGAEWAMGMLSGAMLGQAFVVNHSLATLIVPLGGSVSWTWHRGFPARFTLTARQAWGEACPTCEGTGKVPEEQQEEDDPSSFYSCPKCGRRCSMMGHVECEWPKCKLCHGSGRVGAILPALLKACPVEEVRVSDREPLARYEGGCFFVRSDYRWVQDMSHQIPDAVYDLGIQETYPTPAVAHAALSRAVIRHGLQAAG